jgi:cysteine desulfuration protein SufE
MPRPFAVGRAGRGIRRRGRIDPMTDTALPATLAEIRDEFLELAEPERLQLLLEYSHELPPIPAEYDGHPELCERVVECQSPVYIVIDVDDDDRVAMHATAPAEAPTTRGFASILVQGISGLTADEVLAIPADYPQSIGLTRAVSPLRIAGMTGMLMRAKRQVAAKRAA